MTDPTPSKPLDHGADERIDPFQRLTPFSVDHLARYALASRVVAGKRVLDAATGTGFGAWLLAEAGAQSVDAVDLDPAALEAAEAHYAHEAIAYRRANLDTFEGMPGGPWNVVTCFETLEHLSDPERFLTALKPLLADRAQLFLSVPGEADASADNPFHLQHFDRASFEALIRNVFPDSPCLILAQRLGVAAEFRAADSIAPATCEQLPLEASPPPPVDGYLAIVGQTDAADLASARLWFSTSVWQSLMEERERIYAECNDFAGKYRDLFKNHSDLREKFSVCLAWGTYHHHQNSGQDPDEHFLLPLQEETFAKNRELQEQLSTAQKRIAELEAQLATAQTHAPDGHAHQRKRSMRDFLDRWRRP